MYACCEEFIEALKEKNLNFQTRTLDSGEDVVSFPYQGKTAECFFSGEEGMYLSIYLVLERVPEEKYTEAVLECNRLNAEYKWITYYVDDDKDIIAHNDAILCDISAGDVAFELLVRLLKITEDVKPRIMRTLYS